MFYECGLELWPEMTTRGRLINLIRAFLHILSVALTIVTEAIYDVRESNNCPRTFDTDFMYWKWDLLPWGRIGPSYLRGHAYLILMQGKYSPGKRYLKKAMIVGLCRLSSNAVLSPSLRNGDSLIINCAHAMPVPGKGKRKKEKAVPCRVDSRSW